MSGSKGCSGRQSELSVQTGHPCGTNKYRESRLLVKDSCQLAGLCFTGHRTEFELCDSPFAAEEAVIYDSQMHIYKIIGRDSWQSAVEAGTFAGAAIDLTDGYIHFSTAEQAKETAAKHFAGKSDLLLVAVETERLGDDLKWEPSRGGALFPHLYASLEPAIVAWVKELPLDENGVHQFPEMES